MPMPLKRKPLWISPLFWQRSLHGLPDSLAIDGVGLESCNIMISLTTMTSRSPTSDASHPRRWHGDLDDCEDFRGDTALWVVINPI